MLTDNRTLAHLLLKGNTSKARGKLRFLAFSKGCGRGGDEDQRPALD